MKVDDPPTWRRYTREEALDFFFLVFAFAMLGGVLFNLIWRGAPDIESAFYRAIILAPVLAIASLVLPWKPVHDVGRAPAETPPV
jgi:hypothetical protein